MWSKSSPNTGYGAIIDVHSGSVGIAIVRSESMEKEPEILYSFREYIKISEHPDTAGLVRALRHALFAATLQFSQNGLKALKAQDPDARIGKILLICGAPWAHTVTRFIHVEDKTPFLITEERVKSLILEAERRDETELKASRLLKELNVTLVERAVINTAVNGYLVANPYGKRATELSLAHISGLIPQAITEAVEDMEEKVLTKTKRTTHTFALVLFCVLRDLYPHTKNALFVDISGEATELCVVQDEVLLETLVFPYGAHTLIRDVARHLKTFPDEALGHIKNYTPDSPEAIRTAIQKASGAYLAELEAAYGALSEKYVIPKHFFVTASRKLDSFFDTLVKQASAKYIGPHGTFIPLHKAFDEQTKSPAATKADIFFHIESRFFHKLHGCGEIL